MFDMENSLGYLLNRSALLLRHELVARMGAAGIEATAEEWAILAVLERHGSLPVQALAERTLKDRTTVTRFLDRIEERGLVDRRRSEEDSRVIRVTLTKTGQATVTRMARLASAMLEETTRGIDASDLATTLAVLREVVERLTTEPPLNERAKR